MKKALFATALVIALLFTGCEALGIGVDSFVGTWKLTSYVYSGVTIDLTTYGISGSVVAKSDNTFTYSLTSGSTTQSTTGTWSKSDSTYTLTPSSGSSTTVTLSSDKKTITQSIGSASLVFTKQ
jgi:hypothetical protein